MVEQNEVEAFTWFKAAAEQGLDVAQKKLAECYFKGIGTAQNQSEGEKWLLIPAQKGDAHSQFELGEYYRKGEFVQQDLVKAAEWYAKAAEQGLVEAQERGMGTKKQPPWVTRKRGSGSATGIFWGLPVRPISRKGCTGFAGLQSSAT